MKKLLLACFAALLLTVSAAQAQTIVDNSTLSAAITATDTYVTMGSVTCTGCTFGADTLIYVDLEAMRVERSYVSGTTMQVRRGTDGTRPAAHKSGAVTLYGPANRFYNIDPKIGACGPRSSNLFLPWINVVNGKVWTCDGNPNVWRATVVYSETSNSRTLSRIWTPEAAMASARAWVAEWFRW